MIELLLVIAIIGLLSSVVLASLSGARESAQQARMASDLKQIETGMTLWMQATGRSQWPDHNVVGDTLPEIMENTTLDEYLTLPEFPLVDPAYQDGSFHYHSSSDSISSNCGVVGHIGAQEGTWLRFNMGYVHHPDRTAVHDYLNKIIDGDDGGYDYCGKIRARNDTSIVWYILSDDAGF